MLFKFKTGQRVRKIGGTYQANGIIVSAFKTTVGDIRYVFEFDTPKGMLHIFNESQIELIKTKGKRVPKQIEVIAITICDDCESRLEEKKIKISQQEYDDIRRDPDRISKQIDEKGNEFPVVYYKSRCIFCG